MKYESENWKFMIVDYDHILSFVSSVVVRACNSSLVTEISCLDLILLYFQLNWNEWLQIRKFKYYQMQIT